MHDTICCIGKHNPAVPKSKRLLSNNQSNILVGSPLAALFASNSRKYPGPAVMSAPVPTPSSVGLLQVTLLLPVVQVYISGHGGDGFMKFQDKEEVTSDEIGAAFTLVSHCSEFAWQEGIGKGTRGGAFSVHP